MRVASIIAEDLPQAQQQIAKALPFADVIELRLDYWRTIDLVTLSQLRDEILLPVIFTLRKSSQGGRCQLDEPQRLKLLQQLAALAPNYLDLEAEVDSTFVSQLHQQYPKIQLICSYHDFEQTPADLPALFQKMYHPAFALFKLAVYAHNSCDTLCFLIFLRDLAREQRVIGMAMGEYGQVSRILAPVVGSEFTYGSIDDESQAAPGQLTLAELTTRYRVQQLNRDTAIYALLGDPVSQSRGHVFHNQAFARLNKNAVYVKLKIEPDLLAAAMALLRQLPFQGFSVTMPHKEAIVAWADQLAQDAKAVKIVNTLKRQGEYYQGFNTDSQAGLALLERKLGTVQQQAILILGAGGSAKAIAYALLNKGAKVTLCNRTLARAQSFTDEYGGQSLSFADLLTLPEFPYHAVINTLPQAAWLEQCANWSIPTPVDPKGVVLDIVYTFSPDLSQASITPFLQAAAAKGWDCISGDKFFNEQAEQQLAIWFE